MQNKIFLIAIILLFSCTNRTSVYQEPAISSYQIKNLRKVADTYVVNPTFLGNEKRNFYGKNAPSKLNIIWKLALGKGITRVGSEEKEWYGAGWTGQPLMIKQNGKFYLIQGAYDHHLKKISADNGQLIAQYEFDDVIKGTGSIWTKINSSGDKEFFILQGSRLGVENTLNSALVPSYRCINFQTMKAEWLYNSEKVASYSRDVDGSALIINDTAYLGLENGLFIVFNPDPSAAKLKDGILQPEIYDVDTLFCPGDELTHGRNLITESSPSYLNGHIYVTSGAGHVFGYNLQTKKIDWTFTTGADMDGSPAVTADSCLLISIEKEYISGKGGVMKIDPSLPPEKCVVWYFPTETKKFALWQGGVIGSVTVNDFYNKAEKYPHLAVFTAIDSFMYVVDYQQIDYSKVALGPMNKKNYPVPKLIFKYRTGPAISTPIFVDNKIIAATYNGVYLFEYDTDMNFKLLAHQDLGSFESTPFVWNKRIYVAGRDGFLYCFGENS